MAMVESTLTNIPLAERMRPGTLEEFVGQEHLVGPGRLLQQLFDQGVVPSLLLWGPPGSGKTTLASILASRATAKFVFFSAVLSGVKEIRKIVEEAKKRREIQQSTILFVDEIHRFNKSQQDAFLPHVESGLLVLIGATTENPSFHVIAPLLSRCQVLVLNPLEPQHIKVIVQRALKDPRGLGRHKLTIEDKALDLLARAADGDCRRALNCLETAATLVRRDDPKNSAAQKSGTLSLALVQEALQNRTLRYDTGGEEHYNLISALHKSMRDSDPDGAMYWTARMLESGEDPLYITRRLIRFASEDIGNADPQALQVALNSREAYHMLGTPEGELALLQAVAYLATAPKSNAIYRAEKLLKQEIRKTGSLPVPIHLRNAPTKLMRDLGYGRDYQYAHDRPDGLVDQQHLPDRLQGKVFYEPSNRGYEAVIRDRLLKWRKILKQRAQLHAKKK
ncbi:replication-associated recombination protein A [Desulfolithobacter sp.]